MKYQKGFIQIPILIAIILGFIVVGGVSYVGVFRYQQTQFEKERLLQEKAERDARDTEIRKLILEQQNALEEAKLEIESTKRETKSIEENASKKITKLESQLSEDQRREPPENVTITAEEIEPYLTGVVLIVCYPALGSGSLWNLPEFGGYSVITNKHVTDEGYCGVNIHDEYEASIGGFSIKDIKRWNPFTDISVSKLEDSTGAKVLAKDLNYRLSNLPKCSPKAAVGSPVVVIGYPAFGVKYVDLYNQGFKQYVAYRIATNGIISGHDSSVEIPRGNLPYPNYFVSATIDSGNSGGIAISKENKQLCVLGVPTWLTVGNFATQGLVQNIHNIFDTP